MDESIVETDEYSLIIDYLSLLTFFKKVLIDINDNDTI